MDKSKDGINSSNTLGGREPSVRQYIRRFFDGDNEFDHDTFESLLGSPFQLALSVLNELSFAAGPLLGGYFPANWGDWRSTFKDPATDDLLKSLRWTVLKLKFHSAKLIPMITRRNDIEHSLLVGQFEKAREDLRVFDREHGVSLWSLGTYFRLCELINGTQFNRTELHAFTQRHGQKRRFQWSTYLAVSFSLKAERRLSNAEYAETLKFLSVDAQEISEYALNYFRYRLRSELPADEKSLTDVLHYESRHSLLDLYDTFLVILAQRSQIKVPSDLAAPLAELSENFDHLFSTVCRHHLDYPVDGHPRQFAALKAAVEQNFLGNYEAALRYSLDAIRWSPQFFCVYHVAGQSAAHLKISDLGNQTSCELQGDLLTALLQWYSTFGDRRGAMENLKRLARFLSGTCLGWGIHDFIEGNEGDFSPTIADRVALISSPCSLAQHALLPADTNVISRCLAQETTNEFVRQGIGALLGHVPPCKLQDQVADENEPRRLHLLATALARAKNFAIAAGALALLRRDHSTYYLVRPEAQILEAICLFEVNSLEEAASLTASLYTVNPRSVPPAQLAKFYDLVADESRRFNKTNIAWPIIAAALKVSGFEQLSLDRVHDFVSDYIESNDCSLPTELLEKRGEIDLANEELVFFRDCCTAEIMESSIWIENQEQLLGERLALCEAIRAKITNAPTGIEGEIGVLMRKLAVLDITQRIERSRIFVDTDRIRDRLPQSLADSATTLLAAVAISNRDLNRSLKLLGMPNRDGGKVLLLTVDRGREMFVSILDRLKEQYLYSPELGLDANLSQSIRHGPIISGIRSIFDRSQLITRKSAAFGGEYEPNVHWLEALRPSAANSELIERAFSQLALSVDSFIMQVRNREVQIRSPEKPDGLLDYEFSEGELDEAFRRIEPLHEVDDVLDIAFDLLVSRTEKCLQAVKHAITTDWEYQMVDMLNKFLSQVEAGVPDSGKLSQLRSAVTDCTTEVSRVLEKITGWFAQEDKRENKAFTIRSLVKTLEQVAAKAGQRCVAEMVPRHHDGDFMIDGIFFRSLWDLFFILFDNALKHGGVDETRVAVDVEVSAHSCRFAVSNPIADSTDLDSLIERIEQLNSLSLDRTSDLVKLRSEGGSGIAKLHKIARYEIGDDQTDYQIVLALTEGREFMVEIVIGKGIADAGIFG